ncbi:hypothetical protein [Shimia haliotis]|uniref:Uncharacterized protein n=1 Tax=Shimia haliotis TaxID=1280847 RepID=A0A1I4DT47_9RHOB|nr:hypothetical protein [Shimia haliotis]SFK95226.1 hypothetical protein SAMN04488036_103330 [Shimia haliotis]
MSRFSYFVLSLFTLCAGPAVAQQAFECDWPARADAIVEPWEENSRSFANGDVRLAVLDTIEPAAAAFHLLVLSPPYDEVGGRQCRILSLDEGLGFAGLDFSSLNASYDPSAGLVFDINASLYDVDTGTSETHRLVFTLSQATGDIQAMWP